MQYIKNNQLSNSYSKQMGASISPDLASVSLVSNATRGSAVVYCQRKVSMGWLVSMLTEDMSVIQ